MPVPNCPTMSLLSVSGYLLPFSEWISTAVGHDPGESQRGHCPAPVSWSSRRYRHRMIQIRRTVPAGASGSATGRGPRDKLRSRCAAVWRKDRRALVRAPGTTPPGLTRTASQIPNGRAWCRPHRMRYRSGRLPTTRARASRSADAGEARAGPGAAGSADHVVGAAHPPRACPVLEGESWPK
jgi:hypothetical protein